MAIGNETIEFQYQEGFGSNLTSLRPTGSNIVATLTPVYWIFSVIIVIINGLLLILFIRYKSVRKSVNYFILSQIVTDLTVGLVSLPVALLLPRQRLLGNTSINNALCLFAMVSSISIMTMMLWGVALTAIDRLIAVIRPTNYKGLITKRRCSLAVLSLWIFVLFYYLLPLFNLEPLGGSKWRSYCNGIYRYPVSYLQIGVYIHLALPIIVTSAAYLSMYIVIRRKQKSSRIRSSNQPIEQGLRKAVSAAKMCLITTVLITVGWSPLLIMLNVVPLYDVSFVVRLYAYGISILLAAMVSAMNPLVYFVRLKAIQNVLRNNFCLQRNRIDVSVVTGVTPSVSATGVTPNQTTIACLTETPTLNPTKHTTNTTTHLAVNNIT